MSATPRRARRAATRVAAALLPALLACGPDAPPAGPPADAEASVARPTALEPGAFRVRLAGDRVSVQAREALREELLRELARQAGVELAGAVPPGRITLREADARLVAVLERLLEGQAFQLHYAAEAPGPLRRPFRVVVGREPAPRVAAVEPAERSEAPESRAPSPPPVDGPEGLASADPEERAAAVGLMVPDPESLPVLIRTLAEDPDPEVRVAAAQTLSDAGSSPEAVEALLRSLDDRDPQVVIAGIEALEWIDDPDAIPPLRLLLNHRDAEVRERAADAIAWLRD